MANRWRLNEISVSKCDRRQCRISLSTKLRSIRSPGKSCHKTVSDSFWRHDASQVLLRTERRSGTGPLILWQNRDWGRKNDASVRR